MIIFRDLSKLLLAAYNTANNQAISLLDVEFVDVRPVATITPKPNTTKNTAVTMRMKDGSSLTGETTLYYDRVSLANSFKNAPLLNALAIGVTTEKTLHEILPIVNRRLGTRLQPSDVYNQNINMEWGIATVTIRATEQCLTFVDELVIGLRLAGEVVADLVDIEYDIQQHSISNKYSETASGALTSKFNQQWRTAMFDYSSQAAVLKSYVAKEGPFQASYHNTNIANCQTLANALKAVDGLAWVAYNSVYNLNLYGHWMMYNGPTASITAKQMSVEYSDYDSDLIGILDTVNREYDNVMVIMLNNPWNGKDGWRESLVIHYNN